MDNEHNSSPEEIYEKNINNGNSDKNNNTEKEYSLGKEILEMIVYFIAIVVIFVLLQVFVGQHIEVNGKSMEETLHNKDHLILEKISYRFSEPARFDIIVFRPFDTEDEEDTYFIKRIIGLPGDTVKINNGQIFINNQVLEEDYGIEKIMNAGIASNEIILEDDEYFLLGDNRNNSSDSRASAIGPVEREKIIGRAWARIWPLNSIEILKH